MTIQESVDKAKTDMVDIAEKIIDMGYTPHDFEEVLSKLILDEMEYIELQHTD